MNLATPKSQWAWLNVQFHINNLVSMAMKECTARTKLLVSMGINEWTSHIRLITKWVEKRKFMKRFENLVLHKLEPNAIRHVVIRYLLCFNDIFINILEKKNNNLWIYYIIWWLVYVKVESHIMWHKSIAKPRPKVQRKVPYNVVVHWPSFSPLLITWHSIV
jgi:hypothetical protein